MSCVLRHRGVVVPRPAAPRRRGVVMPRAVSSWRHRAAHRRRLAAHQTKLRFPKFYQERTEDSEKGKNQTKSKDIAIAKLYYY